VPEPAATSRSGPARLLYDRQITPEVITGSSGGAIVALKLAEGGAAAAAEADQLLRSLANAGRVYNRQPWLVQLAATANYAQQTAAWVEANGPGVAAEPAVNSQLNTHD
jgi:predicted acylesterase/phospholipase RssA